MSRPLSRWARSLRARGQRLSIGRQVFSLYAVLLVLVVGAGLLLAASVADRLVRRGAEERVLSVAATVASMPQVAEALDDLDPSRDLQPLAERLRRRADVSFVVVMTPEGIRHTHPNPNLIGGRFIGTIDEAREGGAVVETFEGTLGPSVRAVVPIRAGGDDAPGGVDPGTGEIVGLVAVGVTVDQVSQDLTPVMTQVIGVGLVVLVLAGAGMWWIARRLARQTFGMRPVDVAGLYAHHEAVLRSVREGLVVVDRHRRVALVNDAAKELLGIDDDVVGRPVDDLPVGGELAELLASGATVEDRVHLAGERLVVASQVPVGGRGSLGTVLTLRDRTQVVALADELSSTRSLADALRAQVHESANRLHTVVMLVELGDVDAAVRLATGEVRATRALTNRLVGQFEEPTLVALLLGKVAEAAQRSVELVVTEGSRLTSEFSEPVDLVTIVGNLVDNAVDAALAGEAPRRVEVAIEEDCGARELLVRVRDTGPGFSAEAAARVFEPGWSTKPSGPDRRYGRGIGMALVQQVVTRRGGHARVGNAEPDAGGVYGGAVVEVRVPLAAARSAAAEASGGDGEEGTSAGAASAGPGGAGAGLIGGTSAAEGVGSPGADGDGNGRGGAAGVEGAGSPGPDGAGPGHDGDGGGAEPEGPGATTSP
jgi:two-component system CitB family sensor kinase